MERRIFFFCSVFFFLFLRCWYSFAGSSSTLWSRVVFRRVSPLLSEWGCPLKSPPTSLRAGLSPKRVPPTLVRVGLSLGESPHPSWGRVVLYLPLYGKRVILWCEMAGLGKSFATPTAEIPLRELLWSLHKYNSVSHTSTATEGSPEGAARRSFEPRRFY